MPSPGGGEFGPNCRNITDAPFFGMWILICCLHIGGIALMFAMFAADSGHGFAPIRKVLITGLSMITAAGVVVGVLFVLAVYSEVARRRFSLLCFSWDVIVVLTSLSDHYASVRVRDILTQRHARVLETRHNKELNRTARSRRSNPPRQECPPHLLTHIASSGVGSWTTLTKRSRPTSPRGAR